MVRSTSVVSSWPSAQAAANAFSPRAARAPESVCSLSDRNNGTIGTRCDTRMRSARLNRRTAHGAMPWARSTTANPPMIQTRL